jgi:hypothetical protein
MERAMKIPRIQLGLAILVMVVGALFTVVAPVYGPKHFGYYGYQNHVPTYRLCVRYNPDVPYGIGCYR